RRQRGFYQAPTRMRFSEVPLSSVGLVRVEPASDFLPEATHE
ncbi:MAG: hypothetical protein ACI8XO_003798, partial [Verrucomicrobiales bacterium]